MRYVLGIDGGGSKTYAVVVDELGRRLGESIAGCGNHQVSGLDAALREIKQAGETAVFRAGLQSSDLSFVQCGLAGADRDRDFSVLRPALATLSWSSWDVVSDALIGLRTGSSQNTGVVLICGSGTNAAGRNHAGVFIQTGGFGYLFGDSAGGQHMAVETLRAAIRSWEQREAPSILPGMVAQYFGYRDIEHVYEHLLDRNARNYQDIPVDLARVLHEAAEAADPVAIRILETTGQELGLAANSVLMRLGGFTDEEVLIVLIGAILQKGRSPYLLHALSATISQHSRHFTLVIPDMEPVYGAVLLAMDHLGIHADENMMRQFESYGRR